MPVNFKQHIIKNLERKGKLEYIDIRRTRDVNNNSFYRVKYNYVGEPRKMIEIESKRLRKLIEMGKI